MPKNYNPQIFVFLFIKTFKIHKLTYRFMFFCKYRFAFRHELTKIWILFDCDS